MKKETKSKKPFHLSLVISVIAAAAVLMICFFFISVQVIKSDSMAPTLQEKDITVSVNTTNIERGDVIAFYFGNRILIRRCIGVQGDWIDIDDNGSVFVNNVELEESYLDAAYSKETSYSKGDIQYPYQVPAGRYFVLGDNREQVTDSRNSLIGCISKEQLTGKVILRIAPISRIGFIEGAAD